MLMMFRDTNIDFQDQFQEPCILQMKHSSQNGQGHNSVNKGYRDTIFQFFRRTQEGHKNRNAGPQRPQLGLPGHKKGHNQIAKPYIPHRQKSPNFEGGVHCVLLHTPFNHTP